MESVVEFTEFVEGQCYKKVKNFGKRVTDCGLKLEKEESEAEKKLKLKVCHWGLELFSYFVL